MSPLVHRREKLPDADDDERTGCDRSKTNEVEKTQIGPSTRRENQVTQIMIPAYALPSASAHCRGRPRKHDTQA
jgi:hypothetical protein